MNTAKKTPVEELQKKEKLDFKFKTKFKHLESPEWFSFYPKRSYFKFQVDSHGYFDPRPEVSSNVTSIIVISILLYSLMFLSVSWFHLLIVPFLFFGWGDFYFHLPFDTGMERAESPSYGFYMYHIDPAPGKVNFPTCFIWQWNSYNSWDMPWAYTHIRHSILLKDMTWEHSTKENKKFFFEEQWKNKQYVVEYDFTDKSDNSIIPTKVYVEKREWRQHWLKWTDAFAKIVKSIDVEFSKEVGSRKGSWKGGTVGCGYPMKKGETALECIKRMEQERTFR